MRKVTNLVKEGKKNYNSGSGIKVDRSYTTNLNYLDSNSKIIHKNRTVGDIILDDSEYESIPANDFIEDNKEKALRILKANLLFKKTKNGYNFLKPRFVEVGINLTTRDTSYINKKFKVIAENRTHIQILIEGKHRDPHFSIIRKNEYNFTFSN